MSSGFFYQRLDSRKIIVITAHYDHGGRKVGKIRKGDSIYMERMTNAQGRKRLLLALAAYFSQPQPQHADSCLLPRMAEENGKLQGAKALLKDSPFLWTISHEHQHGYD